MIMTGKILDILELEKGQSKKNLKGSCVSQRGQIEI
jgi:hypothetical protein